MTKDEISYSHHITTIQPLYNRHHALNGHNFNPPELCREKIIQNTFSVSTKYHRPPKPDQQRMFFVANSKIICIFASTNITK